MFLLIYIKDSIEVKPFSTVKDALAFTRQLMTYGEGSPYCVVRDKAGRMDIVIKPEYFLRVWKKDYNLDKLMEIRNEYTA